MEIKKSVMNEIVSVFIMILVVSILAGLTFLFVSQLKTQSVAQSRNANVNVINESVTFDDENTIQSLAFSTYPNVVCGAITYIANQTTTGSSIATSKLTQTNCDVINATSIAAAGWGGNGTVFVSYPYTYTDANQANAYSAINGTENAGYTVVGYLPLIFLAVIFGAILTLVLKIILPFINLGQKVEQF